MSIQTHVGLSQNPDLVAAVEDAARQSSLPGVRLVLFLVTFNYPTQQLSAASRALATLFPGAIVAGGTVNGLTLGERRYDAVYANDLAAAVVVFAGDFQVAASLVPDPRPDAFSAGRRLGAEARAALGSPLESGLIFTPGLASSFPFVDQLLLDGVRNSAPKLRLTGTGFSGGITPDSLSVPGFAVLNGEVTQLGALLIAFANVTCGSAIANGMQPLGQGAFITEVDGYIIKTLNSQPARDVALDLLSQGDAEAREHFEKNPVIAAIERGVTFAVADPGGDFYWTHPFFFFTPDGGGGDGFQPRKGAALSLVSIAPHTCMMAVKEAAEMLIDDVGHDGFELVLAFSCSLRGFTLGPEVAHEDVELSKHLKARNRLGVVANFEVGCYRHGLPRSTAWAYALFSLSAEGGQSWE
jgi:hypothetical protein